MNSPVKIINFAINRHLEVFKKIQPSLIEDIAQATKVLFQAIDKNQIIFICGNGGSAAQSQHFAAELVCRYKKNRDPLKAIALTTDTSTLTAIGNDYNFVNIFSRQLQALSSPGDVLIVLTTSGQSPNILEVLKTARISKLKTIALTGENGTRLKNLVDLPIIIPSLETARIQESHDFILHAWCETIDAKLLGAHG